MLGILIIMIVFLFLLLEHPVAFFGTVGVFILAAGLLILAIQGYEEIRSPRLKKAIVAVLVGVLIAGVVSVVGIITYHEYSRYANRRDTRVVLAELYEKAQKQDACSNNGRVVQYSGRSFFCSRTRAVARDGVRIASVVMLEMFTNDDTGRYLATYYRDPDGDPFFCYLPDKDHCRTPEGQRSRGLLDGW